MSKKAIRFGVTNDKGLRSATWSAIINNKTSDVYVYGRLTGGFIKVSLHESGSWHFGYTPKGMGLFDTTINPAPEKYVQIWQRPATNSKGITLAFRIIIPFFAIKTPIGENDKKVSWILNCPEGKATEVLIFFTSQNTDISYIQASSNFIGSMVLTNGETLLMIYQYIDLPPLPAPIPSGALRYYQGKSKDDLVQSNDLRAIAFVDYTDGSKAFFDLVPQINLSESVDD
jgi:hypothetical protein